MDTGLEIIQINKKNKVFKVYNENKTFWENYLNSKWENDFFNYFENIENLDKKIFIDIGSSNGCLSLYASFFCKKVISLDPEEKYYKLLKKNLDLNKSINNVVPLHAALNTKDDIAEFKEGKNFTEIMFLNKNDTYKINLVALETLLKKYADNDKFIIKIDIEGYEFDLLNDKRFMEIINKRKPEIFLGIHLGAGPLFKYKISKFKFLQRFYNLHKTFLEYKLIYKLSNSYKKICINGAERHKLFFLKPEFYRKNLDIFYHNQ